MRTKLFLAAALAATTLFAACTKDGANMGGNGDGTSDVKIRVSYPELSGATRAEGGAVADGTKLTLKPGHIFFTDNNGLITVHVGIGTEATASTAGSQQVTIEEILYDDDETASEAIVERVSTRSVRCYILSNDAAVFTGANAIANNMEGQNISTILTRVMNVGDLNVTEDATTPANVGNVTNVPLYGLGLVTFDNPGVTDNLEQPYDATVNVQIDALASRIQIKKITGIPLDPDGSLTRPVNPEESGDETYITAFTVQGIYINYLNHQMLVNKNFPTPAGSTLINNGQVMANYLGTATTYKTTATVGALANLNDQLDLVADDDDDEDTFVAAPTSPNVWAYNVFPVTPALDEDDVPHVIIRLSSVTYKTGADAPVTVTDPRFLNVTSYRFRDGAHQGAEGEVVDRFRPNNIYTLDDIQFDYTDLSPIPEDKAVDVLVSVTMMSWLDNPIEWNN